MADENPEPRLPVKLDKPQVRDLVPIFDTDRFAHMQRVATLMSKASMIPAHLIHRDPDVTMANCFMIVNQAQQWHMDPLALAQSCFILHGRLGYEGKLIAALVEQATGAPLDYEWTGTPGADSYKIRVTGKRPSDGKMVFVEGTVGDWKTFEKGDGDSRPVKGNWRGLNSRNQLAYRGAREWARLHAPGIMLGVYSIDELEDERDAREMRDVTPAAPPPEDDDEAPPVKPERTQYQSAAPPASDKPVKTIDASVVDRGVVVNAGKQPAPPKASDEQPKKQEAAKPETTQAEMSLEPQKQPQAVMQPAAGPDLSALFAKITDEGLKRFLQTISARYASVQDEAGMKSIWNSTIAERKKLGIDKKFDDEKTAFNDAWRAFMKQKQEAAAKAKEQPAPQVEDGNDGFEAAPPPDEDDEESAGTNFDIEGHLRKVEFDLGHMQNAAAVNRCYNDMVEPAIQAGVISDDEVEMRYKPLLEANLERVGYD